MLSETTVCIPKYRADKRFQYRIRQENDFLKLFTYDAAIFTEKNRDFKDHMVYPLEMVHTFTKSPRLTTWASSDKFLHVGMFVVLYVPGFVYGKVIGLYEKVYHVKASDGTIYHLRFGTHSSTW